VWTKYYSRARLPIAGATFRGSFWWRNILKLIDQFKGMAMVSVKDGKSCFLWHNLWVVQFTVKLSLNCFPLPKIKIYQCT
jgi:hypothetical protein